MTPPVFSTRLLTPGTPHESPALARAAGPAVRDPDTGCPLCALRSRRWFTGLMAGGAALAATGLAPATLPAWAQAPPQPDGLRGELGSPSRLSRLVPADQLEAAAAQQYQRMMQEAAAQRALAPDNHQQVVRLRHIAERIIPHATPWNSRAARWRWEVNLIGSPQINAFVMPGGKIAFYYGILQRLQLDDDEVAAIMGHEAAHALREHARQRMGQTAATRLGAGLVSSLLGLGGAGDALLNMGGQLLTLRFSREDESEADLVGLDLSARAGYRPEAGVSLWQKMMAVSQGAPPQFLSTHPAGATRIRDIQATLPKVQPLYQQAAKPTQRFSPPPAAPATAPATTPRRATG
jgi:predicted Zn-dependent protease